MTSSPEPEPAISPVVASILLLAVTIVLAVGVAVFVLDMGSTTSPPSTASTTIDREGAEARLQIQDMGTSETVLLETPLGTTYNVSNVGETTRILATEGEINIYGESDGKRTLLQSQEVSDGISPDIIVSKDGTGDYRRIQWAIDNASVGETIIVKYEVYEENINVSQKNLTLIAEHGTVIADNSSKPDVVSIDSDNVTLKNFIINGDPDPQDDQSARYCVAVRADNATLIANHLQNCSTSSMSGTSVYVNGLSATVISNNMTASDYGIVFESGEGNHHIRGNSFTNNTEQNAVNTQSEPVDMQHNSWDTETPHESVQGTIDTHPASDSSADTSLTGSYEYVSSDGSDTPLNTGSSSSDSSTTGDVNGPPIAEAGENITRSAASEFSFDGSDSVDPDGDELTYMWDFGDGTTATGATPSHTYDDVGTYSVTLTVTDSHGKDASDTLTITATGTPLAQLGPNRTIEEETTITFDGSTSTDPDGEDADLIYEWDFEGDGQFEERGPSPSWTYSTSGVYDATLVVTDEDGNTDTETRTISVEETPLVSLGDQSIEAYDTLRFTSTIDYDGDTSDLSYAWKFGDGSENSTEPTPSHTYSSEGTYTVILTVSDGNTADTGTMNVEVDENEAPDVQLNANKHSIETGESITFSADSTDPESDSLSFAWDFGDGTTTTGEATQTHTYTTGGAHTVTVVVTDEHGASTTQEMPITAEESPFKITSSSYDTEYDGDQACQSEFGSSYQMATWGAVETAYDDDPRATRDVFEDTSRARVSYHGSSHSGDRAYWVRHEPDEWVDNGNALIYDGVNGDSRTNYLWVGSWTTDYHILCTNE